MGERAKPFARSLTVCSRQTKRDARRGKGSRREGIARPAGSVGEEMNTPFVKLGREEEEWGGGYIGEDRRETTEKGGEGFLPRLKNFGEGPGHGGD